MQLPDRPPFALRARVLTPLAAGGIRDIPDGVVSVGEDGRIDWVGDSLAWTARFPTVDAGVGDARKVPA